MNTMYARPSYTSQRHLSWVTLSCGHEGFVAHGPHLGLHEVIMCWQCRATGGAYGRALLIQGMK